MNHVIGAAAVKSAAGEWVSLEKARFTADSNPVLNIDAGTDGPRFFLATGGSTENTTTKLRETIRRKAGDTKPPTDLPKEK